MQALQSPAGCCQEKEQSHCEYSNLMCFILSTCRIPCSITRRMVPPASCLQTAGCLRHARLKLALGLLLPCRFAGIVVEPTCYPAVTSTTGPAQSLQGLPPKGMPLLYFNIALLAAKDSHEPRSYRNAGGAKCRVQGVQEVL